MGNIGRTQTGCRVPTYVRAVPLNRHRVPIDILACERIVACGNVMENVVIQPAIMTDHVECWIEEAKRVSWLLCCECGDASPLRGARPCPAEHEDEIRPLTGRAENAQHATVDRRIIGHIGHATILANARCAVLVEGFGIDGAEAATAGRGKVWLVPGCFTLVLPGAEIGCE